MSANFSNALLHAEVGGSFFFDKIDNAARYYYWIEIVSINGTVGELIGPASAVARPTIQAVIEGLTGLIDAGMLAQALKADLDKITLLQSDLHQEVMDRETGQTSLAQAIADAQAGIAEAHTFLINEAASRTSSDSAIITQLTGVAATLNSSIAAVQNQATASINALTGDVNALQVSQAAATSRMNGIDGEVDGLAATQSTMQASLNTLTGNLQAVQNTQVSVQADLDTLEGTVTTQAGVQATMTANLNTLTNRVSSLYTLRLSANGLIGGFGLSNDGVTVEAGFDVDRFWVGRTNADKVKPFIIEDDIVYINQAAIPKLTADKINGYNLKVMGGTFGEWAWPASGSGFYLGSEGLRIGNLASGSYFQVTSTGNLSMPGLSVVGGAATFSGNLNAAGGTFAGNLNAAGGTFSGNLSAAGGTFSGTLTANAINAVSTININGNAVTSHATASGTGASISTSVTVPAGEVYRVLYTGLQDGTPEGSWTTGDLPTASLTLTRAEVSRTIPVEVTYKYAENPNGNPTQGYAAASIFLLEYLSEGTHTVTLTGRTGLQKHLVLTISKR